LKSNKTVPIGETVDSAVQKGILYTHGLEWALLEGFSLAFDKFHPLQLRMAIDDGEDAIEVPASRNAAHRLTGQSTMAERSQESKCKDVCDGVIGIPSHADPKGPR
jgi:hypothetical protein